MVKQQVYRVTVGPKGRVVIPAALRSELGIAEGDELTVASNDGALEYMTRDVALARLRQLFAEVFPPDKDPVQELIDERRAEGRRELEEYEAIQEGLARNERRTGT